MGTRLAGWRTAAAALPGANLITLANNGTGSIQAGSYIKFGNHDKVYLVLQDVDPGGTLMVKPNLVAAVPTASALIYRAVPFTMKKDGATVEYGVNNEQRRNYETSMVEVV